MRTFRLPPVVLTAAFAAACSLTLAACDSDGGATEADLDGTYTVSALSFDPLPSALSTVNVKARLDTVSTQVNFAAGSKRYAFTYRIAGEATQDLLTGGYDVNGNRATITLDNRTARQRLLLPGEVRFNVSADNSTLTYEGDLTDVNLATFDPDTYGGLNAVDGRLTFVLRRR